MSGFTFDANIVIDALLEHPPARDELARVLAGKEHLRISRMAWIEVLSKGGDAAVEAAHKFLSRFEIDEIDEEIASRAACLRRERSRLRSPDAIILATAQLRGRTLVTRNTKDFPAGMPGIRVPYTI